MPDTCRLMVFPRGSRLGFCSRSGTDWFTNFGIFIFPLIIGKAQTLSPFILKGTSMWATRPVKPKIVLSRIHGGRILSTQTSKIQSTITNILLVVYSSGTSALTGGDISSNPFKTFSVSI